MIKILTIAFLVLFSNSAQAYSTPLIYSMSPVCNKLVYHSSGIDAFVDYLSKSGETKEQAIKSLSAWEKTLKHSYSSNPIVASFIKKELIGITSAKKLFIAGKITTPNQAKPYIGNYTYLRRACINEGK